MKGNDEFFWLALKPQQNFTDLDYKKTLAVISRASKFGFFVLKEEDSMKIIARTGARDRKLFCTIPGMTAEEIICPTFDKMLAKCVVLKRRTLAVLLDIKTIIQGNAYPTLWDGGRDSMMACLVCDSTDQVLSQIRHKKSAYETKARRKDTRISSKETDEHESAKQRQDHAHYSCCIIFGVRPTMDLAGLETQKQLEKSSEREVFRSKVDDITDLDSKVFKRERKILEDAYKEKCKEIEDRFRPQIEAARQEIKDANKELNTIIGNILPNKFEDKVRLRKVKIVSGEIGLSKRVAEFFGLMRFVDPSTFVPRKLYSKSIVLAEKELAHFVSFPTEDDIRRINFEMGPNPTFMHGKTEEIGDTDLDIQKSYEEPSGEKGMQG